MSFPIESYRLRQDGVRCEATSLIDRRISTCRITSGLLNSPLCARRLRYRTISPQPQYHLGARSWKAVSQKLLDRVPAHGPPNVSFSREVVLCKHFAIASGGVLRVRLATAPKCCSMNALWILLEARRQR